MTAKLKESTKNTITNRQLESTKQSAGYRWFVAHHDKHWNRGSALVLQFSHKLALVMLTQPACGRQGSIYLRYDNDKLRIDNTDA